MVSVPIVDAHVHLYDTRRFPYAWMNGVPKLNRPHLPADFRSAIGKAPVDQIVFVEVWVDRPHQMAEAEVGLRSNRFRNCGASLRPWHEVLG